MGSNQKRRSNQQFAPVNQDGRSIYSVIGKGLETSTSAQVVTGYAGLGTLLKLLSAWLLNNADDDGVFEIILGQEPTPGGKSKMVDPRFQLPEEITRHWSEEGVSIERSALAIQVAAEVGKRIKVWLHVDRDHTEHGKQYRWWDAEGEEILYLGSANLSQRGFYQNNETMRRESRKASKRAASEYFEHSRSKSICWDDGFKEALLGLLDMVTVEEALAAGIVHLVDGGEADRSDPYIADNMPHQNAGAFKALWALNSYGFALNADETGAGKTRLAATVAKLYTEQQKALGQTSRIAVVAPNSVKVVDWEDEFQEAQLLTPVMLTYSKIGLGSGGSKETQKAVKAAKGCDLVIFDEAHKLHNDKSNTHKEVEELFQNSKQFWLTATPYNKGVKDLKVALAQIIPEMIEEHELDALEGVGSRNGNAELSAAEGSSLKTILQKVSSRTGADQLEGMPIVKSRIYSPGETEQEKKLAAQIVELLCGTGMAEIPLTITDETLKTTEHELPRDPRRRKIGLTVKYLHAMQSSMPCFYMYLEGKDKAEIEFGFKFRGSDNGESYEAIRKMRERGKKRPDVSAVTDPLPAYLATDEAWAAACQTEAQRLQEAAELALAMRGQHKYRNSKHKILQKAVARDIQKVEQALDLIADGQHERVLTFSRSPITAQYFEQLAVALKEENKKKYRFDIFGDDTSARKMNQLFGKNATGKRVGFLTNKFQQSYNFQGASAVFLFDFRISLVETIQRAGRVIRIDTKHKEVEILFPNDSDEFDAGKKNKFLDTFYLSRGYIQYTLPIPELSRSSDEHTVDPIMGDAEDDFDISEIFEEAFSKWGALIGNEEEHLVSEEIFEQARKRGAGNRVVAKAAVRETTGHAWVLLFAAGAGGGSPELVLIEWPHGHESRKEPDITFDAKKIPERLKKLIEETEDSGDVSPEHGHLLGKGVAIATETQEQRYDLQTRRGLSYLRDIATRRAANNADFQNILDYLDTHKIDEDNINHTEIAKRVNEFLRQKIQEHEIQPEKLRYASKLIRKPFIVDHLKALSEVIDYEELVKTISWTQPTKGVGKRTYSAIVAIPRGCALAKT